VTVNHFNAWRSEIAEELAQARQEFAAASAAVVSATEPAAAAKRELRELTMAFGRLPPGSAIASALIVRREQLERELGNVEGRLTRARLMLANARQRVADLTEALDQLATIAPASEPEPETAKRKEKV
jgi:chromosome segregation ATPase